MAETVLESVLHLDGKVIHGHISRDTMKKFKAAITDTEGIVEQLRLTEGVEIAVFSYQLNKKSFKFSLRAKNYADVNVIATKFGGGGHARAAGCTMSGTVYDCVNNLSKYIDKQLNAGPEGA